MRITADTNLLVRAIVGDDEKQSKAAQTELDQADAVALTLPALCELARVLLQAYSIPAAKVAAVIRRLINSARAFFS